MKKYGNMILIVLSIVLFSGCSTKVSHIGGNVYMAYSTGAGFNPAAEVQNVTEAANEYATKQNKVVVPIDLKTQQGIMGSTPPSATFQFKLVEKDSKEAQQANADFTGINKSIVYHK